MRFKTILHGIVRLKSPGSCSPTSIRASRSRLPRKPILHF